MTYITKRDLCKHPTERWNAINLTFSHDKSKKVRNEKHIATKNLTTE